MNIINAQIEILREALNGKRKHKVFYGTLDDKVIIGNDTRLYIIPKEECAIDLTNVECVHDLQELSLKSIINDYIYKNVTLTDAKKVVDKKTLRVFSNGNENIYVDESLIKHFDLENSTFKGRSRKSPILIYEDYNMVGLVSPFYVFEQ